MRVITGSAKSRRLETLPGQDTRPTTEVVKEAVFSMIQFEIEGANVLDLYAGSGQMGIEALSRSARQCVFVDNVKACQTIIKKNLEHTKLAANARVVGIDVRSFIKTAADVYDIVFMDPPYGKDILPALLADVAEALSENGAIICETALGDELPEAAGTIPLYRKYRYGKTKITVYRRELAE